MLIMIVDQKVDHELIIFACNQHSYDYRHSHCTVYEYVDVCFDGPDHCVLITMFNCDVRNEFL